MSACWVNNISLHFIRHTRFIGVLTIFVCKLDAVAEGFFGRLLARYYVK